MRSLIVLLCLLWATAASATQPNIIVVMLDDARYSDMLEHMPRTTHVLGPRAITFTHAFAEVSICGPARATFLTGRYAHNTGVKICEVPTPDSGWTAMRKNESQTLAVWLKAAGYRTGAFGKYMNGYDDANRPSPNLFVPPGWTTWAVWAGGNMPRGFNYTLNVNGAARTYGGKDADFSTDVLAGHVETFIRQSSSAGRPFFAWFAPSSGHAPWAYPARHAGLYSGETWPGPLDPDITDLPQPLQDVAVPAGNYDETYRRYLRSIASADEAVERFWNVLRDLGELPYTWIFVTSDQGYHFGEHQLPGGKLTPFDTDSRIPLLVRGPNLTERTDDHLISNADFAPTVMRLAGLAVPPTVDGVTFRPLLLGLDPAGWRTAVPLSRYHSDLGGPIFRLPTAHGVRTDRYTFVQWAEGGHELYDNEVDPDQLTNIAGTMPELEDELAGLSSALSVCKGTGCKR